ncbi:MAG TPA: hypothetical protein GX697_02280 [Firmicutes bacterium]|nr:hypothetical protein [Bacillota bacterium]
MKIIFLQRPVKILAFVFIIMLLLTTGCRETTELKEEAALVKAGDKTDTTFQTPGQIPTAGEKNLNRQQGEDKLLNPPEEEEPQFKGEDPIPVEKKTEIPAGKMEKKTEATTSKAKPEAKAEENQPEPQARPEPETGTEPGPSPASGDKALEDMMLGLINRERKAAGVQPLAMHKKLVALARLRSAEMADLGCLYKKHISPTYGSPFEMMKSNGITYTCAGENISYNSSVERAHEKLMLSEGHRRNILDSQFNNVGIGIVKRDGRFYITQMFIN